MSQFTANAIAHERKKLRAVALGLAVAAATIAQEFAVLLVRLLILLDNERKGK